MTKSLSTQLPIIQLLKSLLCQISSLFIAATLLHLSGLNSNVTLLRLGSLVCSLLLATIIAYALAKLLHLSRPWIILNTLFPVTSFLLLHFHLPVIVWGLMAALLIGLNLPTFWTGVPFYPTSELMYEVILNELPQDSAFHFIDLGCGYAKMLVYLAKQRPRGHFQGVEISLFPLIIAKCRALFCRNVKITAQSLWQTPCDNADFIYAFLAPNPMPALLQKIQTEIKPSAWFLVNTFALSIKAQKTIAVPDERRTVLYCYRFDKMN